MLPPHFLIAPCANSFCVQSFIHLKAPVLIYKIRVESGNRVADTDSSARVIWTACWVLLLATVADAGLPSVLALAPFWPAIFPLAEPPQLLTAATCQAGNINTSILGGMDLSKDIWAFILQQPALGVASCLLWRRKGIQTPVRTRLCIRALHLCPHCWHLQATFMLLWQAMLSGSKPLLAS